MSGMGPRSPVPHNYRPISISAGTTRVRLVVPVPDTSETSRDRLTIGRCRSDSRHPVKAPETTPMTKSGQADDLERLTERKASLQTHDPMQTGVALTSGYKVRCEQGR